MLDRFQQELQLGDIDLRQARGEYGTLTKDKEFIVASPPTEVRLGGPDAEQAEKKIDIGGKESICNIDGNTLFHLRG